MDNNRCITIDETSVTDRSKAHRGVQWFRDTDVTSSGSGKRRKLDVSSAEFGSCDHVLSSSCFLNCLRGVTTSSSSEICLDSNNMDIFSRMKKKPPPRAVTCHRKPLATAAKIPTAVEIEEFFAVVEKKEQKRFSDKYNFDVVNDVPMDGRYQWVGLKP